MMSVTVTPASALVDDDVTIVINGLKPRQKVTLVSVLKEEKIKMMSYAHYVANDAGVVDVSMMPSVGGMWEGVEPMAFIWAMKLTPDQKYGTRLMKRNIFTPMNMVIKVYDSHLEVIDPEHIISDSLAKTKIERWYISKDVERIEIRQGRLIATLFVPKGPGPYPAVLDLFGSIGGLVEYRASLLASRGFLTMALAYFWPKTGMTQDLEYFEEAVDLLASHPKAIPGGVGVIGVSKGGELANLISIITHKVRAVVVINGPPFPVGVVQTYKDENFGEVYLPDLIEKEGGIAANMEYEFQEIYSILPIERSKAKHLLIHGSDDGGCPLIGTKLFPQRMVEHGRSADDCKSVIYKDAGHLIEPPHTPHFRAALHKIYNNIFIWGGYTKPHARAQEHSWRLMQDFLRNTLSSQIKAKSHL